MNHNVLIFDIDGTLWDASLATSKGWNRAMTKLGIKRKVTAEEIRMVAGNPYETCVDILLPGFRMKHPELYEILNEAEKEFLTLEWGFFYPEVIEGNTATGLSS